MTLLEAAKTGAKWIKDWLAQNICECEDEQAHGCGRTEREAELREIEEVIKAHESSEKR